MRILLVSPGWPEGSYWRRMAFQFPPLALTVLAALTPDEHEVRILDENIEPLDDEPADLVALTAMTALAPRAYELARRYRQRGALVVMGGYHASACPDEAAEHADAVVVGEAEDIWPGLLADAAAGRLQRRYGPGPLPDLAGRPFPRRDLLTGKRYFFTKTMQIARGCPQDCEFCAVTTFFGRRYRYRPMADALAEIRQLTRGEGFLVFVDDNLIGRPDYALEFFARMRSMRLKWLSHATIDIADRPELLAAAGKSGCIGLFIGFESLSAANLARMGKATNKLERYEDSVRRIHDAGIGIEGAFIFGCDEDDEGVFERTAEFARRNRIDGVHLSLATPFPGTRLHQRLETAGRILDRDWSHYDLAHVVIQPARMSPERLEAGYHQAYRELYSLGGIAARLWPPRRSLQIFGPLNAGVRRACRASGYFEDRRPVGPAAPPAGAAE